MLTCHAWHIVVLVAFPQFQPPVQANPAPKVQRVGEVIIVGNSVTPDWAIRRRVGIYPGQVLNRKQLRDAETRLAQCGLFRMDKKSGIRPTISTLSPPQNPNAEYVDVLIQVEETQCLRTLMRRVYLDVKRTFRRRR